MAEPCADRAVLRPADLAQPATARAFPGASTRAVFMVGAGGHYVWIDPELDAVVVLRWLDPAHAAATTQRFGDALRDRLRER